jgi:hypothetical protein
MRDIMKEGEKTFLPDLVQRRQTLGAASGSA